MVLGNVKKYALEYIFIIIGAFLMAVSTALFLLPNQLSTGGISGIMVKVNKRLFFNQF